MKLLRRLVALMALAGAAMLTVSHLGGWIGAGDALAVGRPWLLCGAVPVIAALWLLRVWPLPVIVLIAAGVGISGAGSTLAWRGTVPDLERFASPGEAQADALANTLAIYQKNLRFDGNQPDALIADIKASHADILTLQEVSAANRAQLQVLAEAYPHQLICPFASVGGVAILSRLGFVPGSETCGGGNGFARALLHLDDGRDIAVISVHLHWPYPFGQRDQVRALAAQLAPTRVPTVLAGDFNMVPWGHSVRELARVVGAERPGGYVTTFPRFGRLVPLAIDHILLPRGAQAQIETRSLFGSDHLGLLARFVF